MRCLLCGNLTFFTLCKACFEDIKIQPKIRKIDNLKVYSFYDYQDIEYLLHANYHIIGSKIYKILTSKINLYLKAIINQQLKAYGIVINDKFSQQS